VAKISIRIKIIHSNIQYSCQLALFMNRRDD